MIELKNLTVGNRKDARLIENQSLTIAPGTLTALVGRNGCGKSTLLRTLAGLQKPLAGEVFIAGNNLRHMTPQQRAEKIAVVTSEPMRIDRLTCRELVALGRSPYTGIMGNPTPADNAIVDKALQQAGITDFANRQISRLSDGECRRVMLARALAQSTPIILLDEPTSFLDIPGRYEICALLSSLAHQEGKTIIYSTHELQPALHYSDNMLFMRPAGLTIASPANMSANEEFRMTMRLDLLE